MQFTKPTHRIHCILNHKSVYQDSYEEQIEKDYSKQEQFFGIGTGYLIKSEKQSTKRMYENYIWGESDEDEDETKITVRTV